MLTVLTNAKYNAKSAYDIKKREYEKAVSDAKWDAERKITQFFFAIYGADLKALSAAYRAAEAAEIAEIERTANDTAEYPIGTKMKAIINKYRYNETTIYGIFEVVTSTTEFANNLGKWSRPSIGRGIVRLLKKDGTPSKRIDTWLSNWTPIDETIQRRQSIATAIEI